MKDYHEAELAEDKEEQMEIVASALEQDLELIGSTAIEDKLQEDVG